MPWMRLVWFSTILLAAACGDDDTGQDTHGETPTDKPDAPMQPSGGSKPSGPCSTRHCDATALFTCFEWGVDDDEHVRLCGQTGGEVGAGPCPDANKVAGCKSSSPFSDQGCVINWGYGPALVEADVSEDCQERKGELVQ
jgi:hypothetical protein